MYTLATLEDLRAHLGLDAGEDDDRLRSALQAAQSQIERRSGRRLAPYWATLAHDADSQRPTELALNADLLELSTLTGRDGGTIDTEHLLLLPSGDTPASIIHLLSGQSFTGLGTGPGAVQVRGIWGWHDRPSQAWRDSATAVQDITLEANATTVNVGQAAAADAEGNAPRFRVGQLIRVADEFMLIQAITVSGGNYDDLTVQRGVGSTAAVHYHDAPVSIYSPPPDLRRLVLRWAAWLYREPDGRAEASIPAALLDVVAHLRRHTVRS